MALRATSNYDSISSSEDWLQFFLIELQLSADTAQGYADELASQNVTGTNIVIGLAKPGFLSQFNISIGHQLELESKFMRKECTNVVSMPRNKVPTPVVRMDISQAQFDQFVFEWQHYKEHYGINQNIATSLFFCCDEDVRQQIRIAQSTSNIPWTEDLMMNTIRQTVLSKVSPIVHVKQFMELRQEENESVQKFLQRLQGKASCCNFYCRNCLQSSAEERVKEKFILGLNDVGIQKSALKTESVTPNTPLSQLLTEAITLEQSTRDQVSISSTTSLDHGVFEQTMSEEINAMKIRKTNQRSRCSHCGTNDHTNFERQEKCPAWGKKCNNCGILNHFQKVCQKPKRKSKPSNFKSVETAEIYFIGEVTSTQLLPIKVESNITGIPVTIDAFPDTGANICLIGPAQLKKLQMKITDLEQCNYEIGVAGGSTITATGWTMLKITLGNQSTESKIYFSSKSKRFFLSRQCCQDLHIVPKSFPYPPTPRQPEVANVQHQRIIPQRPQKVPFKPVVGNVPALKKFLLDSFATSTFNRDKPFPELTTPPAHIHLKPDHIVPTPAYWPATIAEHWAKEVKDSIDRDVEAGILTKVPFNEATQWCARMVVVKKRDGRPRRTVDFQDLNKQCLREPNHGTSPFHTARQVPQDTWKSVFDAVDGYHSVKIDEASSKLTTFITPWGRYRYLRFPQGHCSAGDAFNGRVQEILAHIPRLVRIVDDMCIYDRTIEEAFWHSWDLLTTCAEHGIVINESKFQFCALEVEFAGLTITVDGVKPSNKILQAIRDFPPPTDISKARGFFGLLNQVQWAYANSSKMSPFRELVKPNSSFQWTPQVRLLFEEAKSKILQQVKLGVTQYNTNRATCIQTDFCKQGLGYLLLQKFCNCSMEKAPLCCTNGWRLVFAGSRFTKGAEANYAPTEGEALAVAWALNHAHIFTKGCPNLIVSTDHKPLLGILNSKPMESIKNPRILRLKEHTLGFDFSLKYNKGKWHRAADALSRNPATSFIEMLDMLKVDCDQYSGDENIVPEMAVSEINLTGSITLDKVRQCTAQDEELMALKFAILNGFPNTQHATDPAIRSFFNGKEHLWIDNGVVMFKERIVVPKKLRQEVLNILHSAHQGTKGMRDRASNCVYWPGLNNSIDQMRQNCKFCDSISPSQARQPLKPLPPSTYPFEFICVDAFMLRGREYLVVADKFSGWLLTFGFRNSMISKNVIESLMLVFRTYGTPLKMYSDGGLAFSSSETTQFLKRWGVEHIISSARYPQSNGRAELAVKTAKRILHENVSPHGSLETEAVSKALLQYRNTPIQGFGLSPAQILFHRNLRDSIPIQPSLLRPHTQWLLAAKNREEAFEERNRKTAERYDKFTRNLKPLGIGTTVLIQEDYNNKKRWDKTGVVVKRCGRKYDVRMNGSGRIISRNRRFLRGSHHAANDFAFDAAITPQDVNTNLVNTLPITDSAHDDHSDHETASTDQPDLGNTQSTVTTDRSLESRNDSNEDNTQTGLEAGVNGDSASSSNIARMLKRLYPHNKPGLTEQ